MWWGKAPAQGCQCDAKAISSREVALEARAGELAEREQHVQELRRVLAAEHAAVLQALPHLQAWCGQ